MTETTPGQAAYETSYTVRGYPINISWDERDATDRHAWEAIAQAAIDAAAAAGIFAVAAGDEYRVSLPGPIHLGPGIAVRGCPAGGTTFERTDIITDRAELAAAATAKLDELEDWRSCTAHDRNRLRAKLDEIRRLCEDGGQAGQVWGGKPRVAGDSVMDIILDIIGQDDEPGLDDKTASNDIAPDLRPRDGQPRWHDVTCGSCGEEFGTNFPVDEIECAECEARRCPNCRTWFGGESPDTD